MSHPEPARVEVEVQDNIRYVNLRMSPKRMVVFTST